MAERIPDLQPIVYVDLVRYSGFWYEIARLPNSFETNCVQSTAEYTLKNEKIEVLNRCSKANGFKKSAKGIIRIENAPHNSQLKVNFVPRWLRWTGLGWGDYWIIELDNDYQYAVVSEPNREYLWILSRTPFMKKETYDSLIKKLENMHFRLSHLIVSGEIVSKS
ncbi:MAG: lipocalin family protein [Myxococcaceae bacterium]